MIVRISRWLSPFSLPKTHWVTQLATHSGTQGATHLTINISAINDILKNIDRHINRHIERHNKTLENTSVSPSAKDLAGANEKEREGIDWNGLMDYFNEKVRPFPGIPQIKVMTESRKRHLRALLGKYTKKDLAMAIEKIILTPFLRGENDKGWAVKFDWLILESNFVKIMEGNYNGESYYKKGNPASGRSQGRGATIEGVAREILLSCKGRESGR